jgi:hypothetical protein
VIVIWYVPLDVPEATITVSVDVPDVKLGLNVAVTPCGWPFAERATCPAKPLVAFTAIENVVEPPPLDTDRLVGDTAKPKFGTTGVLVGGVGVLVGGTGVFVGGTGVLLGALVGVLLGGTGVLLGGVLVAVLLGVLVEVMLGVLVGVLVEVTLAVLVAVLVGSTGVLVGVFPTTQLTFAVLEFGPPPASALGLVLSQAV